MSETSFWGNFRIFSSSVDSDVVISSRIRFARNLSDFVFPRLLSQNDAERIHSLVYDACCTIPVEGSFQFSVTSTLDPLTRSLLSDRGIISAEEAADPRSGIVLGSDFPVSISLNDTDHVRISAISSGFDLETLFASVSQIDEGLQQHIQFASDGLFGYLTTSFKDCGSGMKLSVILHIPAISVLGMTDRILRDVMAEGFAVRGYYNTKDTDSLGAIFEISTVSSGKGSANAQLSSFSAEIKKLVAAERAALQELIKSRPTVVKDMVFRAMSVACSAKFISVREAVEIISRVRLGIHAGLITGIKSDSLSALLYTVKNANIVYQMNDGPSPLGSLIEPDVVDEEQKLSRLRAHVIQCVLNDKT